MIIVGYPESPNDMKNLPHTYKYSRPLQTPINMEKSYNSVLEDR